jgi:hypothetical protein
VIWVPFDCTLTYFWEEYKKGKGLEIFIYDQSNIFVFPRATAFE